MIALASCTATEHDAVKAPHKIIKIELSGTGQGDGNPLKRYLQNAYINFYKDGKIGILTDDGKYLSGNYTYQEAANIWEVQIASLDKLLIAVSRHEEKEGKEWTILEGNTTSGTGVKMVFEYDTYYQYENIDQLNPGDNIWRNTPKARQSDKELKAKLTGQLKYIKNYFQMLEEREDAYFNGKHLNTPFAFYANGLGLLQPDNRKSWEAMFFDTTDAMRGFEMLEDAMNSIQTKLIVEETPSGIYNNILGQMLRYIEA